MNSWKAIQTNLVAASNRVGTSVGQLDLSSAGTKLSRQFQTLGQQVREQTGQAEGDDVTELPEDYKNLERRVDALRNTHLALLKIAKVYETETYDYPTQVNESLAELSQNATHTLTFWAAAATKGTNLPQPQVTEKAPEQHKTLAHALSRASASGAVELSPGGQPDRLGAALQRYAVAQDKIGSARLEQDKLITKDFVTPWSATLNSQIAAAMKSRAAVKSARLYLDTCRTRAKGVSVGDGNPRAEQVRLEVEGAEEALVNSTEEAINQMRAVLESPAPIVALSHFVKAQQAYHAKAAQFLADVETEIEEASTAAEAEFRKTRS